jgi:hypothetical protein
MTKSESQAGPLRQAQARQTINAVNMKVSATWQREPAAGFKNGLLSLSTAAMRFHASRVTLTTRSSSPGRALRLAHARAMDHQQLDGIMPLNSEGDPAPGSASFWVCEVCVTCSHTHREHFAEHIA